MELKVRKIGNSFGVILPGEVIELPNPQGPGFQLVPDTAEFSRQMEIARGLMQRYRETLRELAK
jgi:hypothetical protein